MQYLWLFLPCLSCIWYYNRTMLHNKQSTLGISVSEGVLYYVELLHHRNLSRVGQWGRVDLGGILQETSPDRLVIREHISRIMRSVSASVVVYETETFAEQAETWQELFIIAGLRVCTYNAPLVFGHLGGGSNGDLSILHFTTPTTVSLYREGSVWGNFAYPFSVDSIIALQNHATNHAAVIALCGHFGVSSRDILADMELYNIPSELLDVWRTSFDVGVHIPSMPREISWRYALAIGCAQYGLVEARKVKPPILFRLKKPVLRKNRLPRKVD